MILAAWRGLGATAPLVAEIGRNGPAKPCSDLLERL